MLKIIRYSLISGFVISILITSEDNYSRVIKVLIFLLVFCIDYRFLRRYQFYPNCPDCGQDDENATEYESLPGNMNQVKFRCKCGSIFVYKRKDRTFSKLNEDQIIEPYKKYSWILGWMNVKE